MLMPRIRTRVGLRCDDDDGECICPQRSLLRDLLVACAPIVLTGALEWLLRREPAAELDVEAEAPEAEPDEEEAPKPRKMPRRYQ